MVYHSTASTLLSAKRIHEATVSSTPLTQPARRRSSDRYAVMPAATPATVSSRARCDGELVAMASPDNFQVTDSPSPIPRSEAVALIRCVVNNLCDATSPSEPTATTTNPWMDRGACAKLSHCATPARAKRPAGVAQWLDFAQAPRSIHGLV